MKQYCNDIEVNWWAIKNESLHIYLGKSKCILSDDSVYYEDYDGNKINYQNKITTWDWSKVSELDKKLFLDYYSIKDDLKLLNLHNKYMLSGYTICCDVNSIKIQLKLAIKHSLLWKDNKSLTSI